MHHIATDKIIVGGFTKQFKEIFSKAGMSLQDPENKIPLSGHKGVHAKAYHQYVLDKLTSATKGLKGDAYKKAVNNQLEV